MSAGASRLGDAAREPTPPARDSARSPRVWALTEGRAGDDAQVLELASALGWPLEVLELQNNSNWHLVLDRAADLLGLGSAPVRLPDTAPADWPDLVVAIAGRSVSTARRIVRASGGRARTVHLGRPVASLADFDLVITTPQYGLPERDNVLLTPLPFSSKSARSAPADARFVELPRPWTAVLIGGDSGSYRLGERSVAKIAEAARAAVAPGGSVLASTSPRTPERAAELLGAALPRPRFFYPFVPDDPANPYAALLAQADRFIVTGESASLIAEASSTGKPVEIVALEEKPLARALVVAHRWLKRSPIGALLDVLCSHGLWMPPRDLAAIHQALAPGAGAPVEPERVLDRIRALLEPGR